MQRERNFDLLRAISCISIVLLHVASLYTEHENVIAAHTAAEFSFSDFFQIITRTAVPCFVMLSGAFMLGKKKLDISGFYKNSFLKLGIPTILFSLIYIFVRVISKDSIKTIALDTLNGSPIGHMWYMFMLVGLYAVYPMILYFKNSVSKKTFAVYTAIALVLSSVVHYTCQLIWPVMFMEYIGYFMAGYLIRTSAGRIRIKPLVSLSVSAAFLLLTYLLNELSFYNGYYISGLYRHPDFPTVIIASLFCFLAFAKMKTTRPGRLTGVVVKYSMLIYLVHPLVYGLINKLLIGRLFDKLPTAFWYVFALFAVTLAASVAISAVYQKIFDMIARGLSKRKRAGNK